MSRVLFVMLHPGFVRYYDDAVQALTDAGHDVHLAFEITRTKLGENVTAQRLAGRSPRLTCGTTPERRESVREFLARGDRGATRSGAALRGGWHASREEAWESLRTTVRLLADYLRFFEPAFDGAVKLRDRAEKRLPRIYVPVVRAAARGGAAARACLAWALAAVERLVPAHADVVAFVRDQRPDLLLVTPLIELGSQQVDYIKAARQLGVRSALCVASWDNLTSKGLARVLPEHVVVWNEAQKTEAVTLHGARPEQVVVTGAQLFDRWFAARPSRSREEFCARVGLDPGRPFVLYLGSSIFIAPDEVPFAEDWIGALRRAPDASVAEASVLIRPHPANARQWRAFDSTAWTDTAIWPPVGTDPNAPDFQRDFFDSMYYSAAVVGINTSALIESAIVGRPLFTIQEPQFAHAQVGTLHFRHLVADGGVVRTADSLDAHVAQLTEALAQPGARAEATRRFVQAFVRPHGLDAPAVPVFVRAIESMLAVPPPPPRPDAWWRTALRPFGLVLAFAARALAEDRPLWAHALRPAVTAGVWSAALGYATYAGTTGTARLALKRTRRSAWRIYYESAQRLSAWRRSFTGAVVRRVRHAGGAAKRAVRRDI